MRKSLPGLSHYFGIQPWQVADLTFGEVDEYLSALRAIGKTRGGGRGAG